MATRLFERAREIVGPRTTTLVNLADPLYDDLVSEATLALIEGRDPNDAIRAYGAGSGRSGGSPVRCTSRRPDDRTPFRAYPAGMSAPTIPERDIVSWDDLDRLVADLAGRLVGTAFDVLLCITRGGLVPAGMLAYRLRIRNILVAAVAFYDDEGQPGPHPTFLQFPADPLLRGQRVLIVDEVWESGTTIHAVTERVIQAGGIPTTAVLHYKPGRSRVPGTPDLHAVETDNWVVYPFKAGN